MPKYAEAFVTARKLRTLSDEFILEIVKNPTLYEISHNLPTGARGIIDPEGNMYFESYDSNNEGNLLSKVGHEVLERMLKAENLISYSFSYFKYTQYGLPIQREMNTNKIYIGESLSSIDLEENIYEIKKFLKKVEQLHPEWIMYPEKIDEYKRDRNNIRDLSFADRLVKESFFSSEKVASGLIVEVYINPTPEEMQKNVANGARGYISPAGDLYLEGYDDPSFSRVIHPDFLKIIYAQDSRIFPYDYADNWNNISIRYGVTVQRAHRTNDIYVGESDHHHPEEVLPFLERAKQKNPLLNFVNQSITTVAGSFHTTDWDALNRNTIARKIRYEANLNIVPTEDYHINNEPIKTEPNDDITIDNGVLTVRRDGDVSTQLPTDKIDHIYFEDLYEIFPYKNWDKETFLEKTKEWTFFGDRAGGVAIREKSMNKIVAIFGHPRSIQEGFKQLLKKKGKEPIWGMMDEQMAEYLEQFRFRNIPRSIISLYNLPEGRCMVANNSFLRKITESEVPSIVQKWILSMLGGK